MKKICVTILLSFFLAKNIQAQPDDLSTAENIFNDTRLHMSHSIENIPLGQLGFNISHRFGNVNTGYQNFFGLDEYANWRLGLDYGISSNLMVGIGRSGFEKLHDIFVKYKVLNQMEGQSGMPVSASLLLTTAVNGEAYNKVEQEIYDFHHRLSYLVQLQLAKKVNNNLSLQLTPAWLHQNLTVDDITDNSSFIMGGALRHKIIGITHLLAQYQYNFNYSEINSYMGQVAIGIEMKTFSHNFSLIFTNSTGLVENQIYAERSVSFFDGGIHFGFNISRRFNL